MTTILIVEDHALSRQALTTLLGYYGHRLLEATEGSAALEITRTEHLDLIITDIVMPTMDGVEFVRQLRADKRMEKTPVIFYTATYRLPEARRLVAGFGNCQVIPKPSEPTDILRVVNGILGISPAEAPSPQSMTNVDILSTWNTELHLAALHLAALVDLSFHLLSQRDPARLLDISCDAIRNILNCRHVHLVLLEENGRTRYFGLTEDDEPTGESPCELFPTEEILAQVVSQRRTLRRHLPDMKPAEAVGHRPPYESLLIIPFATQNRVYGWLSLAGKLNGLPFSGEDEEMAAALGSQTALAYENLLLVTDMKQAKEAAESAASAKSRFLANMSHELRTPMTGVLGMLELALEGPLEAEQRDFIETAHTSARSLVRILNDILDLTKIEIGKLSIEEKPFPLRKCLEESINILLPAALSKGLDLNLVVADNVPRTMIGDQTRLNQVLTNLVGNAIKFTERGNVDLRVIAGDSTPDGKRKLIFTISDTGIGIPDDKKHFLFRPFSQVDESHSRNYGGTGLGLAISKEIVDRMGGTITFMSEEGKGSAFSCSIPLGEIGTARNTAFIPENTAVPGAAPGAEVSRARLLIAEDDRVTRQLLGLILERANYDVDFAENGEQVVDMWENGEYGLILMDVQMPRMDGFDATSAIREKERTRGGHTPIVAMTAHAFKEDEERCIVAGMDTFIAKPIDRKKSLQLIREILKQK